MTPTWMKRIISEAYNDMLSLNNTSSAYDTTVVQLVSQKDVTNRKVGI